MSALARGLTQVAVDGARDHVFALELRDESIGAALRPDEHQRAGDAGRDRGEHLHPVHLVDAQEPMRHVVDRLGVGLDLVTNGIAHVAPHQHVDLAVERRGEQQRLAIVRNLAQDPFDLGQEAHVGHAVGFVDDERADRVEVELTALEEVDHAAGCRDRDRDLALQVAHLLVERRAAVERGDAHADNFSERCEHVDHLLGQLARRHEDERGRVAGHRLRRGLEHGQAEGERLARAGAGLAAHVAAGERVGDRGLLDGKCLVDALGREGVDELGPQAEISEGRHSGCLLESRSGGRSPAVP